MKDVSKGVADRIVVSAAVIKAIEVQGEAAVSAIERNPRTKAPRTTDLGALFTWLARTLQRAQDELQNADVAYAAELADDAGPRATRDRLNREVRALLVRASDVVRGAYGVDFAASVGLDAPLQGRPDMLWSQGVRIAKHLAVARPDAALLPAARIDLRALGLELNGKLEVLQQALDDVRREEREAQTALAERDAAIETWERTYQSVAETATGLFALAGLDELARRVRPTVRKRAGLTEEEPEPTPGPTDPAG